jgi:hypothetical protein
MSDDVRDALEDMAWQFAYRTVTEDGRRALWSGGLSALERAFAALGWDDPYFPAESDGCQHPGCERWATGGTPTADGYKRLCGEHYAALRAATSD